jgi:hypothetical protein
MVIEINIKKYKFMNTELLEDELEKLKTKEFHERTDKEQEKLVAIAHEIEYRRGNRNIGDTRKRNIKNYRDLPRKLTDLELHAKELPLSYKHDKKINYALQNTSTITILEETKKYLFELKHHLGLKTWDDIARLLYNNLIKHTN